MARPRWRGLLCVPALLALVALLCGAGASAESAVPAGAPAGACAEVESRLAAVESELEVEQLMVDNLNRRFQEQLVAKEVELKRLRRDAEGAADKLAAAEERATTAEKAALKAARERDDSARREKGLSNSAETRRDETDKLHARVRQLEADLSEGGLERSLERAATAEARSTSLDAQLAVTEQSCAQAAKDVAAERRHEREQAALAADVANDEIDRLRRQKDDAVANVARLEDEVHREKRAAELQRKRAEALQRDAERGAAAAGRATTAESEASAALARESRAMASRDKCLGDLDETRKESNERSKSVAELKARLRSAEATNSDENSRMRREVSELRHKVSQVQSTGASAAAERDRWAERAEAAEAASMEAASQLVRAREEGERAARREFRSDQIAIQTEVKAARKELERLQSIVAECNGEGGRGGVRLWEEAEAVAAPSAEELARVAEAAAESETVLALLQKVAILEEGCDADAALGDSGSASKLQGDAQLRRRLSRIEAEYERQRRLLDDRETRLSSVKEARDTWRQKAQDSAGELALRTEELRKAAADRADVKRRMAAEEAAEDARAQLAVVRAERDMAKAEVERLNSEAGEAGGEAEGAGEGAVGDDVASARVAELEAELTVLREAVAGTGSGAEEAERPGLVAGLQEEVEREAERAAMAEAALARAEASSLATATALDDAKAGADALRSELLEVQDRLSLVEKNAAQGAEAPSSAPPSGECVAADDDGSSARAAERTTLELEEVRDELRQAQMALYVSDAERDKWSREAMSLSREVENLRAFATKAGKGGPKGGPGAGAPPGINDQAFNLRGYDLEW